MDKGGTKRGGFFHLFDWNKKSRKKLFSSGTVSPESSKQEKKSKESFSTTCRPLVNDDEIFGVSSGRRSCDYSCALSMTDEDGLAHRAPGVIAKLMGLDSMPTSNFRDFDTRSLPDRQRDKRSSEFFFDDQFSDEVQKYVETRSQRMPSSPIERFQTEPIPPRSGRSFPLTHHKLLSPIKNSGYVSTNKNASYIMEAAAKILDHRDQPSVRHNGSSFRSTSVPLKVCNSKSNTLIPQSHRRTRVLDSSASSFESTEFRNRNNGKSSNGAEATGKGKTVSLAIQAKVNVQRREGLLLPSRSSLYKEGESESFPTFKNQVNSQKNRQQQKSYASNTSGAVKPYIQKQNYSLNRANSNSKQSVTKQLNINASSNKKKNSNIISGNYRFSPMDREEPSSSSYLSNSHKKRLTGRSYIQSNVIIDEHRCSKQHEDSRSNGSDVVSFTFTSPLNKLSTENQLSKDLVEGMCTFNNHSQEDNEDANDISSPGLNVITGDALGLLLDQKLKELTCVPEPLSGFDTIDAASVEHESLHDDKSVSIFGYSASSVNGQEVEECSSFGDIRKDLETSFSNEGSSFSESSDLTDGSGTCSSSIQAQNNLHNSVNKNQSTGTDSELSDSACSTLTENSNVSDQCNSKNFTKSGNCELNFLEEISHNIESLFISNNRISPRLFEKLEENRKREGKSEKLTRKILFDCANEYIEIKCKRSFSTGYQAWLKGMVVMENKTLGREIYDEISKWNNGEDWTIDELVDEDMSSYFGKWLNYETEISELGLGVEKVITCFLIGEVIDDCFIKPSFT